MGIFEIIGTGILVALLLCFCLSCTRMCRRKKQSGNRRPRRRPQKNARRKRRRQQRNCPHPPPTNPQTRIQMPNPPPQQQTSAPRPTQPSGFQTVLPQQQYPNSSSQPYLQFQNPQCSDLLSQPGHIQQFVFAQQQLPHLNMSAHQQEGLYPFAPPPYEPPEHVPNQRQLETRIAIPGLDINQFARPPPPPYDEELQKSEPFKLN